MTIIHVLYRTGPKRKQKERKTCCLFRCPNALFWRVGGGGGEGRKYASSPRKQEAKYKVKLLKLR